MWNNSTEGWSNWDAQATALDQQPPALRSLFELPARGSAYGGYTRVIPAQTHAWVLVHYESWYEIPSKFALIKYVLECASDVGCCMKPAKTIGDPQKKDTFFVCAYLRVFADKAGLFFHCWIHFTMNGCAHAVGWLYMTLHYFPHLGGLPKLGTE